MKSLLFVGIVLLICSCQTNNRSVDHYHIVEEYYNALNNRNLPKAAEYVSDSIVFSEFEFIQVSSRNDWFRQFKWDSVFSPVYKISEISEVDGGLVAILSKEDKRIRFLHDSPTTYKALFEFKNGKISKEHTFEYLDFDMDKWQSRRDTLVKWIDINHPDLSGFIYDQTVKGAQDYLTAIDLYENQP